MSRERCDFLHCGVFPDLDLVLNLLILGEAMRRDKFIDVRGKAEIAYLGTCVHRSDFRPCERVPKLDASISCSSSRNKKTVLMRTPSKSFDCCLVALELVLGCL